MPISFSGLASGLDVDGIVAGLVGVERIPLQRLQARLSNVASAKTTVSDFSKKLSALKTAADNLADPIKFASFSVSSSDTAIATAVNGTPSAGNYAVTVDALAREQRTYANAQASSSTALGMTGTLRLTVGANATVDVNVVAGDTLTTLATKITASGAKANASVLFDGTSYRLAVRGTETGAANAITFEQNGFDLGLTVPANQVQAASDAQIRVDGFTITRPTNQVSDVIPGVTLALAKTSATPIEIKVASDPDALGKKISEFVTAYNDVVKAGQSAAGFGGIKAANSELRGDSSIRSVLGQLSQIMYTPVSGAAANYTTLASVGLSLTRDGKITLDNTKLSNAMKVDPSALAKLFTVDAASGRTGAMGDFASFATQATTGSDSVLQARIDGLDVVARRLTLDSEKMQTRLVSFEKRLRSQFTALESRVSAYNTAGAAVASLNNSRSE